MKNSIIIKGARENNLKNIDIIIPKNKLVIITGLSGSGKSSLAFDTIYAEGQRRYLESLSSYARQFLGGNEKPDVDSIEGLSPAIAIDQKSTNHNPRSTIGTATEIYDYLRVLFARIGKPYCPNNHGEIKTQSLKQITDNIFTFKEGTKLQILSVIRENDKGSFSKEIDDLKKAGFLRIRINKKIYDLDEEIILNKNERHNIELVIDRIILNYDSQTRSRINDSIELALKEGLGRIIIITNDDKEYFFNEKYCCNICNFSIPELEPRLFSFNSPIGACEKCKGLGYTFEPSVDRLLPNKKLTIDQGGIDYFKNIIDTSNIEWQKLKILLDFYKIPRNVSIELLTDEHINVILYGSKEPIDIFLESSSGNKYSKKDFIEGIAVSVKRKHYESSSELAREFYSKYMVETTCTICDGKKLSPAALSVKINDFNIINLTYKSVDELIDFILALKLNEIEKQISNLLLKEIINRLTFLKNVGLEYLTLSRAASTLSGGESQRIRLATQIGSHLTGVLYVLDEPSIGLHQKDNNKLIETLKTMRDLGNTLIVVEHDEDTMKESDYIIDIGPGAGIHGGNVVAKGTYEEILKDDNSLTGKYLSRRLKIDIPKNRRSGNGSKIILKGATGHNLKNIDVVFPLNKLILVTGVSGSGKSTLIMETLVKAIQKENFNPFSEPLPYRNLIGGNHIDKLVIVDQSPIGRTPRSNPATYISVFDDIRELFSRTNDAKEKGYLKGRFSFNVKGGRCEDCRGDGLNKIEMHFLPDVYIKCESCNGKKYNEETLMIKYKNKSIYDILEMPIEEVNEFFINIPQIHSKIKLLVEVGLGYLKLGANSTTLSGGEAQRIKLAKFLQRKPTGKTLYVLDEPTTGLHTHDIAQLIKVFNRIVDHGDSIIVIEHNLELIKVADHIIDIGPDGGINGGVVTASGTPEQVATSLDSHTALYLKQVLSNS